MYRSRSTSSADCLSHSRPGPWFRWGGDFQLCICTAAWIMMLFLPVFFFLLEDGCRGLTVGGGDAAGCMGLPYPGKPPIFSRSLGQIGTPDRPLIGQSVCLRRRRSCVCPWLVPRHLPALSRPRTHARRAGSKLSTAAVIPSHPPPSTATATRRARWRSMAQIKGRRPRWGSKAAVLVGGWRDDVLILAEETATARSHIHTRLPIHHKG